MKNEDNTDSKIVCNCAMTDLLTNEEVDVGYLILSDYCVREV